jgi:hypothetical protein
MSLDTTALRSRRALLAGTAGGLAALAAQVIGRAPPVQAGTGAVMLGAVNNSGDPTTIQNITNDADVLTGESLGAGTGVLGASDTGIGVLGFSSGTAVSGLSNLGTALEGSSDRGFGLRTRGRVRFQRSSGIANISAGNRRVTVSPGFNITRATKVLATITAGNPGGTTTVQRVTKNRTADTFTIHLTANAANGVRVAWFVIS